MVKKVVTTVGQFKDYIDEIQQSYELVEGTFVTPVRIYSGRVYVLDDVATMKVSNRRIATDTRAMVVVVVLLLCKKIEDPLSHLSVFGERGHALRV